MKMIRMNQVQRNAIYAFGQRNKRATIEHLVQVSELMADKKVAAEVLTMCAVLERDEVTQAIWEQNFYTIKHRKEMIMNRLVADYHMVAGNFEDSRPWWGFAKHYMIGAFVGEDFMPTMNNLEKVARLTTDPVLKKAAEEAMEELQLAMDGDVVEYYDEFIPLCKNLTQYHFVDDNYLYDKIVEEGLYGKAD